MIAATLGKRSDVQVLLVRWCWPNNSPSAGKSPCRAVMLQLISGASAPRKKAASAALVFEDWNGPTSSQKAVPETDKAY